MSAADTILRSLVEHATDGMIALDPDLRYLLWNAAMARMTGLEAADVLGRRALDLFPFLVETGEDAAILAALAGRATASRSRPFEVLGTRRRGFYDATYRPVRDADGAVVAVVGTVCDVTERRLEHARLTETEARFRNMADHAPVLLWMSNTEGMCTFFNETWLRFTGRTVEQEWGVGWAAGVHHEDFQRCMDTFVAAFNAREPFEMSYRLRRADGAYRWILDRGAPRRADDGTFAGFIGSCVDITEIRDLQDELRRAVALRDEFLSVASHELRTPLAALGMQVQSLHRLVARDPAAAVASGRVTQAADAIADHARALRDLIQVVLDVSRAASGSLALDPEALDLGALAEAVTERFRRAAEQAGSTLELSVDGDATGTWDRVRLEQVLGNLLQNAIKYGGGSPIRVGVTADDGAVRLEVVDGGIGIAAEDQARIFDRFERAVPAAHFGGLGLGLWIARTIVEQHGGRIGVRSRPGEGARFEVELPRRPSGDDADGTRGTEDDDEHAGLRSPGAPGGG